MVRYRKYEWCAAGRVNSVRLEVCAVVCGWKYQLLVPEIVSCSRLEV